MGDPMSPSDIKHEYEQGNGPRHFFERSTMRFFGDTMRSFSTVIMDGTTYLFRKPSAMVNVFGRRARAGREYFSAYRFDPETADLLPCSREEQDEVFRYIIHRY